MYDISDTMLNAYNLMGIPSLIIAEKTMYNRYQVKKWFLHRLSMEKPRNNGIIKYKDVAVEIKNEGVLNTIIIYDSEIELYKKIDADIYINANVYEKQGKIIIEEENYTHQEIVNYTVHTEEDVRKKLLDNKDIVKMDDDTYLLKGKLERVLNRKIILPIQNCKIIVYENLINQLFYK